MLSGSTLLIALGIGSLSFAQSVPQTQSKPAEAIAIRAAHLVDVKTGELRNNVVILIEGDHIVAIGPDVKVPNGTRLIDLGAATVLPGLIDCHTHLMMRLSDRETYAQHLLTKSQADRALEGAANARETLRAGFTTVRDVESEGSGYADVALRNAIRNGLVEGPRMFVATRGIAAVGQYNPFGISPDLKDFPTGAQMVSGPEDARRAVREQIGHGADLIKVYADWVDPTLTPDELRVIVEEAHKLHRKVAAHATTAEGIRNAVVAGVDSIEHGESPDRATLETMHQKGTFLVTTVGIMLAFRDSATNDRLRDAVTQRIEMVRRTIALARQIGVKMAGGMDSDDADLQGQNARQLTALVRLDVPPVEAIRAETVNAAELLGWLDRIGTLEVGKLADIIAVDGNPLADITQLERVRFVMQSGRVVENQYDAEHSKR